MTSGYYRFPTVYHETVVFVSEDDLWSVATGGGVARRLTSNLGEVTYPMLSPTGEWLAFVGREEGMTEVYVMPAAGGTARRLTYLSSNCRVVGWTPDGARHCLYEQLRAAGGGGNGPVSDRRRCNQWRSDGTALWRRALRWPLARTGVWCWAEIPATPRAGSAIGEARQGIFG